MGEIRARGAIIGIELVWDAAARTPAPAEADAVIRRAVQHGVIPARAGVHGSVIRLLPPLNIPYDILAEALDVLADAIRWVAGQPGAQGGGAAAEGSIWCGSGKVSP